MTRYKLLLTATLLGSSTLVACGGDDGGSADAGTPDGPAADAAPPDAPPTPDAPPGPDARTYDFSCMGMEPPVVTVPDPLVISGVVSGIESAGSGQAPVAGASVQGFSRTDVMNPQASTTSDMNGAYALNVPTNATPVDGFIRFAAPSYITTNVFAPDPLQQSLNLSSAPLIGTQVLQLLPILAEVTVEPGDGIILVQVEDCAGDAIAGATVNVVGADVGTVVRYASAGDPPLPSPNQEATTDNGTVFIFNVPPGDVTLEFEYMGTALQANILKIFPDQATVTLVHP
jgi:hypothetical protein